MVDIASLGPDAQRQIRDQVGKQQKSTEDAKPKFGNAAVVVDGYRFPSQREANRYLVLKASQQAKEISDLKIQPAWRLHVNGEFVCDYVADFSYVRHARLVVEDAKSKATKTPEYRIKRKLMFAVERILVVEV